MLRKPYLWPILILLILAVLYGAKWKQEHPTATARDLAERASLSQCASILIFCPHSRHGSRGFLETIDNKSRLVVSLRSHLFLTAPVDHGKELTNSGLGLLVGWQKQRGVTVETSLYIDLNTRESEFDSNLDLKKWYLHPVTTRHILNALLADPKIGPQLKKAMEG